jgi:hypothetical protein
MSSDLEKGVYFFGKFCLIGALFQLFEEANEFEAEYRKIESAS